MSTAVMWQPYRSTMCDARAAVSAQVSADGSRIRPNVIYEVEKRRRSSGCARLSQPLPKSGATRATCSNRSEVSAPDTSASLPTGPRLVSTLASHNP
jgi:hypothetical protein